MPKSRHPILQSDKNPESKTKKSRKISQWNSRTKKKNKMGMNPNLRDLNWLIQFTRR